jgi:hypothetical protein
MAHELSDTAPEAARVQAEILRAMSPGERLAQVDAICAAAADMAIAGLRRQHPEASAAELAAMLAERHRLAWQLEREAEQDATAATGARR